MEVKHNILMSFKPYYKWNTFNTIAKSLANKIIEAVLNLIINGIPSILQDINLKYHTDIVLNLIINGIPSILKSKIC